MRWLALVIGISSFVPEYALATSDEHVRYPITSRFGACKGSLVEKVYEGSSATWTAATYAAACFTSLNQAEWVVLSDAHCGESPGQISCRRPSQKPTLKKFGLIVRFGTNELREITLDDSVRGTNCTLSSGKNDDRSWSCASYETVASTTLENTPTRFVRVVDGNPPIKMFGKTFDFPMMFPQVWRQSTGKQVAQNNVSPKVAYVGLWATKVAWCKNTGADTDEVPATYTANTITGYEHQCKFAKISSIGSEWTVSARCTGEGESWNYNFRMSVSDDIMVVTDLDKKRRATYRQYRCSP